MKTYEDLINGYKLVIWDGVSDIKCSTGIFTATDIRKHWNIGNGAETFYIIKGKNRSVASYYGTNLSTPYDTEDVIECGKLSIKDLIEEDYRNNLTEGEEFAECPIEFINTNLLITDQRI